MKKKKKKVPLHIKTMVYKTVCETVLRYVIWTYGYNRRNFKTSEDSTQEYYQINPISIHQQKTMSRKITEVQYITQHSKFA